MRIVLFLALSTLPSSSTTAASLAVQTVLDTARATGESLRTIKMFIESRDKEYMRALSVTPVSADSDADSDDDSAESVKTFPDLEDQAGETIPPGLSFDGTIAGHYDLEDLVIHDEAHLLVSKDGKTIFKYHMNCFAKLWNNKCMREPTSGPCLHTERRDPDALLREYAFTKTVFDQTKLAPEPYVLSPAIHFSEQSSEFL